MSTHIEIVRTARGATGQSWHARLRAGNGELTWSTENYAEKRGALEAVELLGRMFSPVTLARLAENGLWLDVWHDSDELGAKFAIPVRYVDER